MSAGTLEHRYISWLLAGTLEAGVIYMLAGMLGVQVYFMALGWKG